MSWLDTLAVVFLPYGLFAIFFAAVRVAELGSPGLSARGHGNVRSLRSDAGSEPERGRDTP